MEKQYPHISKDPEVGDVIHNLVYENLKVKRGLWVVEHSHMVTERDHGACSGANPHVRVRRLYDDGKYNENGEIVEFDMGGWRHASVLVLDVGVVGHMKMIFVEE